MSFLPNLAMLLKISKCVMKSYCTASIMLMHSNYVLTKWQDVMFFCSQGVQSNTLLLACGETKRKQ